MSLWVTSACTCSDERFWCGAHRTYVYSRCTLERHFGGESACVYLNRDLSWLDIRLGE